MKIKCIVCGKTFDAKRKDAQYCSPTCRQKAKRGVIEKSIANIKIKSPEPEFKQEYPATPKEAYDAEANLKAFIKMGMSPVEWITTGITEFDQLTQIPRGRVTQIQGPYAVGKTTLCLNMIKGLKNHKVLYIDSEASLNPELLVSLKLNAKNFTLYNESAFIEDIYDQIIKAADSGKYDMIIFDSLASCTFKTESANEATDRNIGQKALIVNKLMRIVPMKLKDTDTALVIINQEREVIGSYAPIKYTPGGMGVPYAASLMISLKSNKGDRFPKSGPPYKGHTITAEIIKSKVNQPWRKAEFKLYYPEPREMPEYTAIDEEDIDEPIF